MNKLIARIERLERALRPPDVDVKMLFIFVEHLCGDLIALQSTDDGRMIERGPGEREEDLYSRAEKSITGRIGYFAEIRVKGQDAML